MSSVNEIETAIQKLSVAEQRIIALHLGERLVDEKYAGARDAAAEGIPFLPLYETRPATSESRAPKLKQHAKATR